MTFTHSYLLRAQKFNNVIHARCMLTTNTTSQGSRFLASWVALSMGVGAHDFPLRQNAVCRRLRRLLCPP